MAESHKREQERTGQDIGHGRGKGKGGIYFAGATEGKGRVYFAGATEGKGGLYFVAMRHERAEFTPWVRARKNRILSEGTGQ